MSKDILIKILVAAAGGTIGGVLSRIISIPIVNRINRQRQLAGEKQLRLPFRVSEEEVGHLSIWEQVVLALNLIYAFLPSGFLFFGAAFILANVRIFTWAQLACLAAMAFALVLMTFLLHEKKRPAKFYGLIFFIYFLFFFILDVLAKVIG